ncbi:LacI family transcriptional regulator (plasmid) [Embleya sp. NBC_00888]|uniref:LacI family DNA-binding transcriptional regulator n=1 Tax=Embleya sp. NBC_00888 TaxID=2975960 RepID=UPI002F90C55F|nr:LacI family transcriptional regulator [Embleya sp. NBC_00888]
MSDLPARGVPARSATLEDVARVAGVSRSTVSRVVNDVRNVDSALRETVRLAIEATGYVPNSAARSLVTRRAGAIALVVSATAGKATTGERFPYQVFTDPFFGRVVSGAVGVLHPLGMYPLLMLADTARARDHVVGHLRRGSADGALVVSTLPDDPLPALLVEAGVPAVLYARPATPMRISYVDLANHDGARLAADHLVALGCSNVALITGPEDVLAAQERSTGFVVAMARHGHPYVPAADGDFTAIGGERAMARLLAEHPYTEGVFAANDRMAQGALVALRAAGRNVPGDVSVIGFDDGSAAIAAQPALTTVRQPVEDMAAEMTRMLLAHIEDPERPPSSVIFEPTLVVRESTRSTAKPTVD